MASAPLLLRPSTITHSHPSTAYPSAELRQRVPRRTTGQTKVGEPRSVRDHGRSKLLDLGCGRFTGRAPDSPNPTANPAGVRQERINPYIMHFTAKHAAHRTAGKVWTRVLGVMAVGSATIAASVIAAAPAQADGAVWERVAQCESGGNWRISTGNGFSGGLQFTTSSWRAAGGARYAPTAGQASRSAQIAVAQNLLRMQGPGAWPVCSRRAGLTHANGMSAGVSNAAASMSPKAKAKVKVRAKAKVVSPKKVQSTASLRSLKGYASRAQVRTLQTWVGVARDGKWGPITTRAVQKKLGLRASGAIDAATVRKVEQLLGMSASNRHFISKPTMNRLMTYTAARAA